ncbi:hypothetical protein EYZ11_011241 [Aspergillus tanneri]|uniref:Uncharacterized protein n=1 Tax=Aspergillus tanneri TaxID=1220188 RepID=A0A4V3UN11_9EURO|nr:hypothetical protein EYZ11_011241 [Aspergillus tanneri]
MDTWEDFGPQPRSQEFERCPVTNGGIDYKKEDQSCTEIDEHEILKRGVGKGTEQECLAKEELLDKQSGSREVEEPASVMEQEMDKRDAAVRAFPVDQRERVELEQVTDNGGTAEDVELLGEILQGNAELGTDNHNSETEEGRVALERADTLA